MKWWQTSRSLSTLALPVGVLVEATLAALTTAGTHQLLTDLVVREDEDGVRDSPDQVERVRLRGREGGVKERDVGDGEAEGGLLEQASVHYHVAHAVTKEGRDTRLANDDVGPLYHDDGE